MDPPSPRDATASPRRRRVLFAALYAAEGAPIGFIWWALPVLLRREGWSLPDITALGALLALPWTLKVLGAPLVDLARGAGVPLRWVIVTAQMVMLFTLLPLTSPRAFADPAALRTLLLLHAVAAALQDVAIDALCLAVTPVPERGRVNGWMQAGMLVGRGALSAGGLHLVAHLGPGAPATVLCGLLGACTILVLAVVPASAGRLAEPRPAAEWLSRVRAALCDRRTWRALLFAVTAGAGFEAAGAVAGTWLTDRGWTTPEIASWFEIPKVIAMAAGALLGGLAADRWGAARAARRFQVAFVAGVLLVAGVEAAGLGGSAAAPLALDLLYLAIGAFTAASYAWLMDRTAPGLEATQFSAYMGATNACEAWAVLAVGRLIPWGGYGLALAVMAGVSLVVLPLLPRRGEPTS